MCCPSATTLILGSMPGNASLEAGQYYAHPRNAFWPIMEMVLGIDSRWAYGRRADELTSRGVAVWDVLGACERPGSLDSSIVPSSMRPNDFSAFFEAHGRIARVAFNGATAFRLYRRLVLQGLSARHAAIPAAVLPSTSPAMASMGLAAKAEAWRGVLGSLEG